MTAGVYGFLYRLDNHKWLSLGYYCGFKFPRSALFFVRELVQKGFPPGLYRIIVHCVDCNGRDVVAYDRTTAVGSCHENN